MPEVFSVPADIKARQRMLSEKQLEAARKREEIQRDPPRKVSPNSRPEQVPHGPAEVL